MVRGAQVVAENGGAAVEAVAMGLLSCGCRVRKRTYGVRPGNRREGGKDLSQQQAVALLGEAVAATREVGESRDAANLLIGVADQMGRFSDVGAASLYELTHNALKRLSRCGRPDGLRALAALAPTLKKLGNSDSIAAIVRLVLQVVTVQP